MRSPADRSSAEQSSAGRSSGLRPREDGDCREDGNQEGDLEESEASA